MCTSSMYCVESGRSTASGWSLPHTCTSSDNIQRLFSTYLASRLAATNMMRASTQAPRHSPATRPCASESLLISAYPVVESFIVVSAGLGTKPGRSLWAKTWIISLARKIPEPTALEFFPPNPSSVRSTAAIASSCLAALKAPGTADTSP